MARIPSLKRLVSEDFKDQSKWISRLLQPLNQFMSAVVTALNGNLTFADNFRAQIREMEVSGDFSPVAFRSSIGRPMGVFLVNIQDKSGAPALIKAPVSLQWRYRSDGQVEIYHVNGLSTTTMVHTTSASTTLTNVINAQHIMVGQTVSGDGIPPNTTVVGVSATEVQISNPATNTATGVLLTFSGKKYGITVIALGG